MGSIVRETTEFIDALGIPLLPWAVSVSLERRRRQPLRWRFRIKTLLILVVIAALVLGAWMEKQRQQFWKLRKTERKLREREYRDEAAKYARYETSHLSNAATGKSSLGAIGDGMGWRDFEWDPASTKEWPPGMGVFASGKLEKGGSDSNTETFRRDPAG